MEYYSAIKRNEFEPVVVKWMNLEPVTQSEVSQKGKKQIPYIITYIWNLEKWYWWTYLQGRNRDSGTINRLMDIVGQGEGGINWESSIEICTLPFVKYLVMGSCYIVQGAQPGAVGQTRGIRRWGRFRQREHVNTYGWFMLMYGRNQHTIVKQLSSD